MDFKYYKFLKPIQILLFASLSLVIQAQEKRPITPEGVFFSSSEPVCAKKDFLFKIDTSYYPDGSVIYVCDKLDSVTVVFNDTKKSIFGDTVRIFSINLTGVSDTIPQDIYFSILPKNFNNKGVAKAEVEIIERPSNNKTKIDLNIKLISNLAKIDNPKSYSIGTYAFDDHQFNYPGSTSLPSKLVVAHKSDNVQLKMSAGDANKILSKNKFHDYLTPDSLMYASTGNVLNISHNTPNLTMDDIPVQLCNNTILNVDVRPERQVSLAYFTLCHKSDDTPNYCIDKNGNGIPYEPADSMHIYGGYMPDCVTPISSAYHECINRGSDGILTYQYDIIFWSQKANNSSRPIDNIVRFEINGTNRIFASQDTSQPIKYFCNCRPPKLSYHCPSSVPNFSQQLSNINQIYQDAGITFSLTNLGNLELPWDVPVNGNTNYTFDSSYDDGSVINAFIQRFLANNKQIKGVVLGTEYNSSSGQNNNTNTRQGHALLSSKLAYINVNGHTDRTFAHELGHALFGFGHPDDTSSVEDKFVIPEQNDIFNFMNSGNFYDPTKSWPISLPSISQWRIRKYQWRKIHGTPGIF